MKTHSFVNLAKLLELGAQGGIVGVPGKATEKGERGLFAHSIGDDNYPIKSLDIVATSEW